MPAPALAGSPTGQAGEAGQGAGFHGDSPRPPTHTLKVTSPAGNGTDTNKYLLQKAINDAFQMDIS